MRPPPRPSIATLLLSISRRHASSSSSSSAVSSLPLRRNRNRRRRLPLILSSTLSLLFGLGAGTAVSHTLAPPPMPAPGTREDGILLADLRARIDENFSVKVLRGKCLGVGRQLSGKEGRRGWVEISTESPEEDEGEEGRGRRMVQHLKGARGMGVERVFWDRDTGKLVAVVWFGGAMAGWPGVTHGGLLATALTEKLALAEFLARNGGGEEEGESAAVPQRMPGTGRHARMVVPKMAIEEPLQPEELSLTYKKPTYANDFYVIRVTPAWGRGEEGEAGGKVLQPVKSTPDWEATLETTDAKTCVLAQAKFKPSGSLEKVEKEVVEMAKRGHAEFKDWMWPSRQKNSQID